MIETELLTITQGAPETCRTTDGHITIACPDCRIALWSHIPQLGEAIAFVGAGTLDEGERLAPEAHYFTRSKLPWIVLPDGVPAFEGPRASLEAGGGRPDRSRYGQSARHRRLSRRSRIAATLPTTMSSLWFMISIADWIWSDAYSSKNIPDLDGLALRRARAGLEHRAGRDRRKRGRWLVGLDERLKRHRTLPLSERASADLISAQRWPWFVGIAGATVALAAMGLVTLHFGDTLLQWQPLPAATPGRAGLVCFSGMLLLVTALGLPMAAPWPVAARIAGGWILLWAIALHLPLVWAGRGSVASLNGTAENVAMAAGLLSLGWPGEKAVRLCRRIFGLCCIVFGTAHFVYASFTADMIPAWLPWHLSLAYLTGTVHLAAGICLLFGIRTIIAATIEATMMSSFVLLLHIPRVMANPASRLELTMLIVAVMLTSSAWVFAGARRTLGHGPSWPSNPHSTL